MPIKDLVLRRRYALAYQNKWRKLNPELEAARRKRNRTANPETYREQCRRYYRKNRSKMLARSRAYRIANRERLVAKQRADKRANRARYTEYEVARSVRQRGNAVNPKKVLEYRKRVRSKRVVLCHYCSEPIPGKLAELDHVTAIANNGAHAIGNLAVACADCNKSKSDTPLGQWRKLPQQFLPL